MDRWTELADELAKTLLVELAHAEDGSGARAFLPLTFSQ